MLAIPSKMIHGVATWPLMPTWRSSIPTTCWHHTDGFPPRWSRSTTCVRWASSSQRDWDGDNLCVGGQSAGGNLSAAAARLALENGGPQIKLQVLHYAPLDLVTRTKNKRSPAGRAAVLRPWMGEVFDTAYIPDPAQRRDRLASPAWGTNGDHIEGIAPALVVSAEFDRLRDEAAAYADKLDAPVHLWSITKCEESTTGTTS